MTHPPLSPRQVEIMRRICRGLTDKEIAVELGVKPATIGVHVFRIVARLHARNRSHAIFIVTRRV